MVNGPINRGDGHVKTAEPFSPVKEGPIYGQFSVHQVRLVPPTLQNWPATQAHLPKNIISARVVKPVKDTMPSIKSITEPQNQKPLSQMFTFTQSSFSEQGLSTFESHYLQTAQHSFSTPEDYQPQPTFDWKKPDSSHYSNPIFTAEATVSANAEHIYESAPEPTTTTTTDETPSLSSRKKAKKQATFDRLVISKKSKIRKFEEKYKAFHEELGDHLRLIDRANKAYKGGKNDKGDKLMAAAHKDLKKLGNAYDKIKRATPEATNIRSEVLDKRHGEKRLKLFANFCQYAENQTVKLEAAIESYVGQARTVQKGSQNFSTNLRYLGKNLREAVENAYPSKTQPESDYPQVFPSLTHKEQARKQATFDRLVISKKSKIRKFEKKYKAFHKKLGDHLRLIDRANKAYKGGKNDKGDKLMAAAHKDLKKLSNAYDKIKHATPEATGIRSEVLDQRHGAKRLKWFANFCQHAENQTVKLEAAIESYVGQARTVQKDSQNFSTDLRDLGKNLREAVENAYPSKTQRESDYPQGQAP